MDSDDSTIPVQQVQKYKRRIIFSSDEEEPSGRGDKVASTTPSEHVAPGQLPLQPTRCSPQHTSRSAQRSPSADEVMIIHTEGVDAERPS